MVQAVAKYLDERIPRYTSYPTAPHFTAAIGPLAYRDWLGSLPGTTRLSLYLHVPFCQTLCWYCGCNTSVTRHRAPVERYAAVLRQEIALVAARTGRLRVAHIHFGGGTPTLLGPDLFRGVMRQLREAFDVEPGAEIAIEIDPRHFDAAMADAFAQVGVTRASLGVQTFNPASQRAVARVQGLDVTRACAERLRGAGVNGINVDLLYGLPHETIQTCQQSVAAAMTLDPDRLSVFGYAHVPQVVKHQRVIPDASLPKGPARLEQEEAIGASIVAAGYRRVGLDHYARPGDAMATALSAGALRRNFQGYSPDPADALIGLGASSIGQLPSGYVQNATGVKEWAARIEAGLFATARGVALSADDSLRAAVIERLMCNLRVDVPATLREMGFPAEWFAAEMAELRELAADGLAHVDHGVVSVPETVRGLVRRVASVFDAYLDPAAARHAVAV